MKIKKSMLLYVMFSLKYVTGQCLIPIAGTPVWTLAAEALAKMCTVQSKVCDLESAIDADFAGTFTIYDVILQKACDNQTISESIDSTFDELDIELPETISKLCVIESKLGPLESSLEHLDSFNDGIFSAFDNLNTTLCSKIEQISNELTQVQNTITNITQTEIDHTQTILSKLDDLEDQAVELNSALDALSIDVGVNNLDSCTDVLVSLADDLLLDVCNLQMDVENGFSGTFTALDVQLIKSCDLVSLVDAANPMPVVDFSGVFTSLDALDDKVCTMESLVDIVCLINTEQLLCTAGSKIDIALQKMCAAESVIDPLSSVADEVISILDEVDMVKIQDVCSNIEEAISKLGPIESKIDLITVEVDAWQVQENFSKLEQIEQTLLTVCSKLDQFDVTDSKLCVVDSKVGALIPQSSTICSILEDVILQELTIDSKVDSIDQNMQTIESKVCNIENDTFTICSNLDVTDASLETTESKLDIITDSSDNVFTVESRVDLVCSSIEQLPVNAINSKLDITESLACVIESNMDIVGPLIGEANMKAMNLEDDFASTWTILDTIENILCTSESVLEAVDSKLDSGLQSLIDSLVDTLDLSPIFTVVEIISFKECMIDSKVDVANSLADIFVSSQDQLDFSGVYTALDSLLVKVCAIELQADQLETSIINLNNALGTPIYEVDLPYTISTPGRYYLAENVINFGTSPAITIAESDVVLDLNDYMVSQSIATMNAFLILVGNNGRVRICNGTVNGGNTGIRADGSNGLIEYVNCVNSPMRSIDIDTAEGWQIRNVQADNDIVIRNPGCLLNNVVGIRLDRTDGPHLLGAVIKNCFFNEITFDGRDVEYDGSCIRNCKITDEVFIRRVHGLVVKDNLISGLIGSSGGSGMNVSSDTSFNVIKNNGIQGGNLKVDGTGAIMLANAILFNSVIADNSAATAPNYLEDFVDILPTSTVVNTYLGNFSFNPNAVGDPNNANYNFARPDQTGTNLTGKFATVSQAGSFIDPPPTKWTNINMLP